SDLAAAALCFKFTSANAAIFQASESLGCDSANSLASFAAAANCFCSSSTYACFVSAGATVLTTGLTGSTSSNGSFGLLRRAVGAGVGSGRSNGSDAGGGVFWDVCLLAPLGRVERAFIAIGVSRTVMLALAR